MARLWCLVRKVEDAYFSSNLVILRKVATGNTGGGAVFVLGKQAQRSQTVLLAASSLPLHKHGVAYYKLQFFSFIFLVFCSLCCPELMHGESSGKVHQ